MHFWSPFSAFLFYHKQNGSKFPNLSTEYKKCFSYEAEILGDFLNRLLDKGYDYVIVCSAGNDSNQTHKLEHEENGITESLSIKVKWVDSTYISYYSAIPNNDNYQRVYDRIIVVGAIDSAYDIAYYSNVSTRNDIYAPGGDGSDKNYKNQIYSTVANNSYGYNKGTSMAAPHVSGVAALVWTVNNDLTGAEVKRIICDEANRSNVVKSCKMVDAYNAVVAASKTVKETKLYDKENGGVLNFVVDKDDESIRIADAKVTAISGDTVISEATTDQYGHFELILPAGTYDIIVQKDNYEPYTWKNISVKSGEINYLSDWTKLELEKIVVELPDVNDIFYSYIESELIPLYGLSEMHTEPFEYFQEPDYSGLYGLVSASIKQIGTEKYMVTVRLDKQDEISCLIFELYQYSDSKIEKIDTYNFKLEDIYETASYNKYTYLFNIGWSDDYLCFETSYYVYRPDRGGISYHILTIDKEGFKDNYELFERYNTPVSGGYKAFFNNNCNYIEVTNGLVDENEVSAAIEAIKKDLEAADFYNYSISRAENNDVIIDFKLEYDENILNYSLYDQIINDHTDLRSHINNSEINFDIIKTGRYENEQIKIDVKGELGSEGEIRIEYIYDVARRSVVKYKGTLKKELYFEASDGYGNNAYSLSFNGESLKITMKCLLVEDQLYGWAIPDINTILSFSTSVIPDYDISSWSNDMITNAINNYLQGSENWKNYVVFESEITYFSVQMQYKDETEKDTSSNYVVVWGIGEDYAMIGIKGSDVIGDRFHLTEYLDVYKIEPVASNNNWKKEYFEVLMNYINDNSIKHTPAFDLYDIDNDGIPELFITSDSTHYCDEYIYTLENEIAVQLKNCYSDYGGWYVGDGYIFGYHTINGGYEEHSLCKKKGSNLIQEYVFQSNWGAVSENETEFFINNQIVSKEEFQSKINELITGSKIVGRKYSLDEATISEVFKNYTA